MHGSRLTNGLLFAIALWTLGCSSSPWSKKETVNTTPPPAPATAPPTIPPVPPTPTAGPVPTDPLAAAAAPAATNGQTIESILAEVRQTQTLDAKTEEELVRNLHATPPTLWPMVVQQFRAALAYRRRSEERERSARPTEVASNAAAPTSPQPIEDQAGAYHRQPELREVPRPPAAPPAREPASLAQRDDRRTATGVTPLPDPRETVSPPREQPRPLPTTVIAADSPASEATVESAPSESTPPRPVEAPYAPRVAGDWHNSLGETIRLLESQVESLPQSPEEVAAHARLRMLYLANNRRDDALRPIPTLSTSMQDFWSKEFCGLAVMLDPERNPDPARRAGEAQRHLSEAITRLQETAPLTVRNLSFVTDVQSYGSIKPFDKYDFRAGQRVLLYAEIENFKIKESNRGFHTALQSSYRILDSRGQRVADHDFGTNEEHCQNARRDFYIGYDFTLPQSIPAGRYTLQLTVTDLNGDKIGQSSVDFTIVSTTELARAGKK